MRWYAASALRGVIGAAAFLAGTTVLIAGSLMIYTGIAGTGGFTSDPPPDHVPWFNVAIAFAIALALECVIFWGWRRLSRVVDAAESK